MTIVIGKEVADKYRAMIKGEGGSEELCKRQEKAYGMGICEAMIVKSIYGYSLRYASGLNNFGIIRRARDIGDGSYEAAYNYAVEWVAKAPNARFVSCYDPIATEAEHLNSLAEKAEYNAMVQGE